MSSIDDIARLVADALGLDPGSVSADASMDSVEVWDSLQHLGVVTALESAYACRLSPDEIVELTSVARIAAYLESR